MQYPRPAATRQGVHVFDVVGVTFVPGYPENFHRLAQYPQAVIDTEGRSGEGVAVVLMREPENPHDANAIGVHVPSLGQRIGYVPRQIAAELAPVMDHGQQFHGRIWVRIDPAHPAKPGATVELKPVAS